MPEPASPTISDPSPFRELSADETRTSDIRAAGYFIRELAHSWEALKGSQARNDVEAILVAECAHVRKLQRERDGDAAFGAGETKGSAIDPGTLTIGDPPPKRAGIARNGNRKR